MTVESDSVWTEYVYNLGDDMVICSGKSRIRMWEDSAWLEPTVDYMGMED